MVYEFEGRTEKEAIDVAAAELGLARDEFDVELLESQTGGLFKKGKVRLRVHVHSNARPAPISEAAEAQAAGKPIPEPRDVQEDRKAKAIREEQEEPRVRSSASVENPAGADEFEAKILDFVKTTVEKMGYTCEVSILFREEKKLGVKLDSEHASILIGKKGKNLDALQLLVNVYGGRLGREDMRIVIDSENYRIRREEALVKLAYESAEKVRRSRSSILLEPMNPFERRIIHTTLNDIVDIETKSEGDGLYKQVRVLWKGAKR
jgi:spoIIIJ-associated protein